MSKQKLTEEQKEQMAAVDDAIIKVYDDLAKTIACPRTLAVAVAKVYANAVMISYQQRQGKVKIPTEGQNGTA